MDEIPQNPPTTEEFMKFMTESLPIALKNGMPPEVLLDTLTPYFESGGISEDQVQAIRVALYKLRDSVLQEDQQEAG